MCRIIKSDQKYTGKILLQNSSTNSLIIFNGEEINSTSQAALIALGFDLSRLQDSYNSLYFKNTNFYIGQKKLPDHIGEKTKLTIYHNYYKYDHQIKCYYCQNNLPLEEVTVDHFIPLSRGGVDHVENLKISCYPCNSIKRSLHPNKEKRIYKKFLSFVQTHPSIKDLKKSTNQYAYHIIQDPHISKEELIRFYHHLGFVSVRNRLQFFLRLAEFDAQDILHFFDKYFSLKKGLFSLFVIDNKDEWSTKEDLKNFSKIKEKFPEELATN